MTCGDDRPAGPRLRPQPTYVPHLEDRDWSYPSVGRRALVRWPRTFTGLGTCGALRVMIIMVWPSGRLPGLGVQPWPGRWPGRGQAVRSGALGGRRRRVPWRLARVLVSDLRSREGRQAAGEPVRGT